MARPAKRRVDGTSTGSRRVTPAKGSEASSGPPSGGSPAPAASSRYTPPRTGARGGPSPRWVPVLMFALWGLGLLVIVLNYMEVLPGAADGGNGWYLVGGLVAILAGILVATQYR